MGNRFNIGDLEVLVVSDGDARAPGTIYFQGTTPESWEPHKRWLDHEGNVVFPFTCFLVRSGDRTVLIDTGLGPINMFGFTGGALLDELAKEGVKPEDIDTVFVTHLHVDHCGNVALPDGDVHRATFPKATYRWTADEDAFWRAASGPHADPVKPVMAAVDAQFKPANDGEAIAPGINVIGTPGHTPGTPESSSPAEASAPSSSATPSPVLCSSSSPSGPAWATSTRTSHAAARKRWPASSRAPTTY